jgi:hypothetical protein
LIHLKPAIGPAIGNSVDAFVLREVCRENPDCSLDGMSRFRISGRVLTTPMADCKLKVTEFENIRFESQ